MSQGTEGGLLPTASKERTQFSGLQETQSCQVLDGFKKIKDLLLNVDLKQWTWSHVWMSEG